MMDQTMDAAEEALGKAITALMISQPFFGSMVYHMHPTLTRELPMKSAATDGRDLFVDPDFLVTLYRDEAAFVIAHEVLHVVSKHHARRGGRDPELWNAAADYSINPTLCLCQGLRQPKGLLNDKRYHDMTAEQIYNLLIKMPKSEQAIVRAEFRKAAAMTGVVVDPEEPESQAERDEQEKRERDLDFAVHQAAHEARMAGKLPGALSDMVSAADAPKVTWSERLRHALSGYGADDYTWSKFNRAGMMHGVYLPSTRGYACGPIVIMLDSSGSVTNEDAREYLGETNVIVSEVRPEVTWFGQCDTSVKEWIELEDELPTIEVKGRGGTKLQPAFDWVEDMGVVPQVLIYMTDLDVQEGDEPSDPGYPVIWLCNSARVGPFGETIHI
jgi:predicted metal-dependent peptidase